MTQETLPKIGFIGQGWIGKNYADDFEHRGFEVIRYSLDPEYIGNKDKIKDCDMVFIAVPTPSTPKGFDYSLVTGVLSLVGKRKIAIIKSTLIPGTTRKIAKKFPNLYIFHSPEFLVEQTAAYDAAHPDRNVIGVPIETPAYMRRAREIMKVLAKSPFELVCTSEEAEIIKYSHNIHGYMQIVFSNLLFDYGKKLGAEWEVIAEAIKADPMMSPRYLKPVHKSGRGAGGDCFIKDFKAFTDDFEKVVKDTLGIAFWRAMEKKNNQLLLTTKKDIDILREVYGSKVTKKLHARSSRKYGTKLYES